MTYNALTPWGIHLINNRTQKDNSAASLVLASLFLVVASLSLPTVALAQSGAGSIQGTIQDATGAAIAGCSVRVVNDRTSVASDTTANGVGFYSIPGLFAGSYTITFSAPGMKKQQTSLTLQNAQNAVINPTLAVGDVAEQVTVTEGDVQLVTYDSGTVSTHLDRNRIDQLPQNTRNVLGLASATTPGLEAAASERTDLCRKVSNTRKTAPR